MVIVFTKFPIKLEFNEQYSAHLKVAVKKHQVEKQAGFYRNEAFGSTTYASCF